jgi:uncharacterized membrane protein HdeD (DUF308 family)
MFDVTNRPSVHPRHGAAWFAGVGLLDVVAGIFAVAWPGVTVLVLALLFGFLLLMAGLVSVSTGLMVRRAGGRAMMPFLFGGAAVVAGIICLVHPGAGVFAIILGCTVWFLLTGVGQLALARTGAPMRGWLTVMGVLSIVAALILIVNPGVAIATVGLIAGLSFLIRGAGELALGWRLRGHSAGI